MPERCRREQRPVHGLLIGQRQSLGRQRQQRRSAARDEAQHEIILGQITDQREHPFGGSQTSRIGHRMGGLDDLESPAWNGIAIAGHHQAVERARPVILECPRHRGRRLAGTDDDQPPAWDGWQPRRDA
jgi:hypothetical protein